MLSELRIRNFAIIDELTLAFGPGFNILTGETGAGKSIIIDAVSLLLGGRAETEMIRAGADKAEVEGTFLLSPAQRVRLQPLLDEQGLDAADTGGMLILTRELRQGGRSVSRIGGSVVNLTTLREVGQMLVDIHTQGEHFSLLRVREHVELLDRYARLEGLRGQIAEVVAALRQVRRELQSLQQDERERARRIDLLTFQVDEIAAARLSVGEEETLQAERNRLANAEQLAQALGASLQALEDDTGEQPGALDRLGEVIGHLSRLSHIDHEMNQAYQAAETVFDALSDLLRTLRGLHESIEFNPERLAEVEERIGLIFNLKRKYGDTIESILAYGDKAAAELATITHASERIAELQAEETKLLRQIGRIGTELSQARQAAGERLARAIEAELADLRMGRTHFAVDMQQTDDPAGAIVDGRRLAFDATGLDRVEFLVSANPGEPLRPLVKVASGGETARLMLALKTVLSAADQTPTLIFDEIDVGIGGRIGSIVGQKLWHLTQSAASDGVAHQVLCITHLAQLAAFGDTHLRVAKHVAGERTHTEVVTLDEPGRLEELAAMQGTATKAGRQSVQEMLSDVAQAKSTVGAMPR